MATIITIISYVSDTCIRYRHGNIDKLPLKTYKCNKFIRINKLINLSKYVITKNKQINDIICPNSNINNIYIDTLSLDSKLLYCAIFDLDYDKQYYELDIYQNLFLYFFKNSLYQDNLIVKFTKQTKCLNNIISNLLFDNYNNLLKNNNEQIILYYNNKIKKLNNLSNEQNFIIAENNKKIEELCNIIKEKNKDLDIANQTITEINNRIDNFKKINNDINNDINNRIDYFKKINNDINNDINSINKKYDKIFYLIKEYVSENEIFEITFLIHYISFIINIIFIIIILFI